jgi:hypothetical protein
MSAAGIGAVAGGTLGGISSILGLQSQNKAAIGQIKAEGDLLKSQMSLININREQINRELGDILSANALKTAQNMATAKVVTSTSGTIGGTTSQVSRQSYMDQLLSDADYVSQARNQEMSQLMDAVSKTMNYKNRADAIRSSIKSPMEAAIGVMSSVIGGASQGAQIGSSFGGTPAASGSSSAVNSGTIQQQRFTASRL